MPVPLTVPAVEYQLLVPRRAAAVMSKSPVVVVMVVASWSAQPEILPVLRVLVPELTPHETVQILASHQPTEPVGQKDQTA
jgi:hypothetical protein